MKVSAKYFLVAVRLTTWPQGPHGIGTRISKEYMALCTNSWTNHKTSIQQHGVETGNDGIEW